MASRRSIRSYDGTKKITKDEITTLIKTTQEAPSWANTQTTRYYVVISDEKLPALMNILPQFNKANSEGASALIVSTYVKDKSGFSAGRPSNEIGNGWGAYDNGQSNAYLILKAREMGFGTLIMGARDAEPIRQLLNIPESETIMAVIALGYVKRDSPRPPRKDVEEVLMFK